MAAFRVYPSYGYLKNLVFHKNSDSFPCSFALLPSFCCGVKSEIRPDVNVFLKKTLDSDSDEL